MDEIVSGYRLVNRIGTGARAHVFQVVQPETGETFTLKRVFREDGEDTRYLDQAITEHEIAHRLSHPTLRRSIELKKIRSMMRLVEVQVIMEFIDGVGLEKARPESIDRALAIFKQIAGGLQYMHSQGFLHADIKPNNILLTPAGVVKIIDFGQACTVGTTKPRIQGTPDYIAPEQADLQPLSKQTDVFNLGATFYWMVTGKTFPTAITRHGQRHDAASSEHAPPPHELNTDIWPALSRLIMDCCAYDRYARPADMNDMLNRLQTAEQFSRKGAIPAVEALPQFKDEQE